MKRFFQFITALMLMLAPAFAFAHPGHGDHGGFTITHYFTEPEHIALLVLIIAAIVYFVVRRKKAAGK